MDLFSTLLGFVFGLLSSGIISLIWYKLLVPRVQFAKDISRSKATGNNELYTYTIKFRNSGRRDIFEMYLYCTLYLPNLFRKNLHSVDIYLDYSFKPLFKKRKDGKKTNTDGLVKFCLSDEHILSEFKRPVYSKKINRLAAQKSLTLETLLSIIPAAYMKVFIIAHDRFTGTKKIFESPEYRKENIKRGLYKKGELYVVEV